MNWDDGWTNYFYITRQLRRRLRRYSPRRESQLKDSSKDDQLAIHSFHDLTMDWKGPVIDGVGNLCQLSPSFIHVGHWPGDVTWDANLRIAIYFLFWLRFFFQCKPTLRVHWHCGKSNSVGSSQALSSLHVPRPSSTQPIFSHYSCWKTLKLKGRFFLSNIVGGYSADFGLNSTTQSWWKIRCHIAMRGRCFTVRFGRDGAAVESGVKCTAEIGKNRVFFN